MALPSLGRTWRFQANANSAGSSSLLIQSQTLMFAIAQALLAQGSWTDGEGSASSLTAQWAHTASCDSTATSTSTNKWDASTDLIWNTAGNAHSWIVLFNAALGLYLLIDLNSANEYECTIKTSHNAFTGGSTTAAPTATNSQTLLSVGFWGASGSTSTTTRKHFLQSTDGKGTRIHLCRGSGAVAHWIFDYAGNALTGWTRPIFQYVEGTSNNSGEVVAFTDVSSSAAGKWKGIANAGGSIDIAALTLAGSDAANKAGPQLYTTTGDISAGYPFWSIHLLGRTTGTLEANLGIASDLWYGPTALATGLQFPGDEVASGLRRQFTKFGPWIEPWNKSTVQIA